MVTGRLTIPTADGDLLHYSAVASEPLESKSQAPAAEVAASSCLRRAAALAGLGLELWGFLTYLGNRSGGYPLPETYRKAKDASPPLLHRSLQEERGMCE